MVKSSVDDRDGDDRRWDLPVLRRPFLPCLALGTKGHRRGLLRDLLSAVCRGGTWLPGDGGGAVDGVLCCIFEDESVEWSL
jgi:hypothetical protein